MLLSTTESRRLLQLPNEILLHIFHQTATILDAWYLARSCSLLYRLFNNGRNKIDIFRSAANVPRNPQYHLDQAFSALSRVLPLSWRINREKASTYLLIDVDYGHVSEENAAMAMWDLGTVQSRQPSGHTFVDALRTFLKQFDEIRERWTGMFESATEDLLAGAANLQQKILDGSNPSFTPVDLSTSKTVIALAFHCYLLVCLIPNLDITRDESEEELFQNGSPVTIIEGGVLYGEFLPTTKIHRKRKESLLRPHCGIDRPGYHVSSNIDAMVDHITKLAFELLDTQDPQHWPTVLYVLIILNLIPSSIAPVAYWLDELDDASDSIYPILTDLARYYYVCTGGGTIMSSKWHRSDYELLVGDNIVSVEHAQRLNTTWLEHGELVGYYPQGVSGLTSIVERGFDENMARGIDDYRDRLRDFAFSDLWASMR
ncbi:hypothetical protein BJX99DRAFT_130134 [Aspergillus californicus]